MGLPSAPRGLLQASVKSRARQAHAYLVTCTEDGIPNL